MRPRGLAAATMAGALAAAAASFTVLGARASGEARPARLLIEKDSEYAREASALSNQGMNVLADYGSFVLVEVPAAPRGPRRPGGRARVDAATAGPLAARGFAAPGVRVRREIAEGVRLWRRTVTGVAPAPAGDGSPRAAIVRLAGPPKRGWVESLESLPGLRVLMALPDQAYLTWLPPAAEQALGSIEAPVEFADPLRPEDRIHPDLDAAEGAVDVALVFVDTPGGAAAAAAAADRASGVPPRAAPRLAGLVATVLTLDRSVLEEIAAWPELVWAEPYERPRTHDEVSSLITGGLVAGSRPLGPRYREWLALHGLDDLSSYVVQVVDTGIDAGGAGPTHPALAGRLAYSIDETGEGIEDDCVGHGTHIAGIIAGNPPPGLDLRDAGGYEMGLGVAPTARVGSSRIFDCSGDQRNARSFTEIFAEASARGARVSNNSWGGGGPMYSILAREYDALARDADGDPSNGDQPMVIVVSAGNNGLRGLSSVDAPSVAKNVIAVGATESYRPGDTDGCGVGPAGADDAGDIRPSSSRGLSADGRLKPDLLAPGSHILSLVSRSPRHTGLALCDTFYPPSQRLYSWTSGSSQAAAHASGAAVLLMEDHRRRFGALPSPAMVKAEMTASARDLARTGTEPGSGILHRPTGDQGWGRLDLSPVIGARFRESFDQADVFTSSGQERLLGPFIAADPARSVSIVLAWTDAPGTPSGFSWVNDLDLEVAAGGVTYLGNVTKDGVSAPGGAHDGRNNLETVFLEPPVAGPITVKVTAVSVAGDGVPSHPGLTDQDFALYLDNVVAVAARGRIAFERAEYACGQTAEILVSDGHLAGDGTARVEVRSGAEPLPEPLDLDEDPPGSGLFRGLVRILAGPPARDGALQALDGDALVAEYRDADDGAGAETAVTASAVSRCSALTISDVRGGALGADRALVTWRTDRASDSTVVLADGTKISDPTPVLEHHVEVGGLDTCAAYRFRVASTDLSGASATAPQAGFLAFSTGSGQRVGLLEDDFEASPGLWSHGGVPDEWELGVPAAGPGRAFSGARAWATDLHGPYDEAADLFLVSPPVDLRERRGARLSFRHWLAIPVAAPGLPQDGAWVEVSTDGGATWMVLAPDAGYPADQGPNNPYLPARSRVYAGTTAGWIEARFDLSHLEGKVIRLRFRLWRDPDNAAEPGDGWYIDDVVVSAAVGCHEGALLLDRASYGCTGQVRITLADSDLNDDLLKAEVASVVASTTAGSVSILLTELAANSGVFTGVAPLSPTGGPGRLRVAEGDTVMVRYTDADDGSGSGRTVQAAAPVADCGPPAPPSDVRVRLEGTGSLRVDWADPADADLTEVRIHYDSDGSGPVYSGQEALEGVSPVRAEAGHETSLLRGLHACVPHFVSLTAVDAAGNESPFSAEAIGIPAGGAPCARATLLVTPGDGAGCTQALSVLVNDANADPDPLAPGAITVSALSSADPAPLTVTLVETGPATGAFAGSVPLAPAASPGRLVASEGGAVEVRYLDPDAGGGASSEILARIPVDDCTPPAISDVRIAALGFDEILVEWETDEPSTSVIEYGLDPGMELSVSDPALAERHALPLPGLPPCAAVYFRVVSADARGNAAVADDGGGPFRYGSARDLAVFSDDFESGAPGWTHAGAFDEWELGAPSDGPPGAASGTHVWGIDLDGFYERGADMTLTSPSIDLTGIDNATLTFNHWYDIYSSRPGGGLDDGAWVEASRDGGATWTYLVPEGGYPDQVAVNPYVREGTGAYAGRTTAWEAAVFDLGAVTGARILLRFHFYQDAVDPSNAQRAGWYLDDVQVHAAAACRRGRVRLEGPLVPCGAGSFEIRLWDEDLDADPLAIESASVRLGSPSDPQALDVTLFETGASTGAFAGSAPIGAAGGPGALRVSDGDVVTAIYDDADDGTGAATASVDVTRVGECAPPVISSVRAVALSGGAVLVEWDTDEPSTSEVRLLPSGSLVTDAGFTTRHAVVAGGLTPCAPVAFEVASEDVSGNRSAASDGGPGFRFPGAREITVLSEGFESGAPGWSHGGLHDEWEIGAPLAGPPGPFEGASVAGTDLDGPYDKDVFTQRGESFLVSPSIVLDGMSAASLSFRHWRSMAVQTEGDGGVVEVLDRGRWRLLVPVGGYPGRVRIDRGEATIGAFTERSAGWIESRFDLSPYLGRAIRFRFRMILDHGTPVTATGWYVDDVRVTGVAECRRGLLLLDAGAYRCGPIEAGIVLADADLDADPGVAETAAVRVTVGGASRSLALQESGPGTGVFRGRVRLSPLPPGPGDDFQAIEGDALSVDYDDADVGDGSPGTATAAAAIDDCAPPEISRVRLARTDGTTIKIAWETDEPATTEAALSAPGAPPAAFSSAELVTHHAVSFPGLPDCAGFSVAVASADANGSRAEASGAEPPLAGETLRRRLLFRDDMEGSDPGWSFDGFRSEWERGRPLVGPPYAFSGTQVVGTDLIGFYESGTESSASTPLLDLRGAASPILTVWHFYDVFADAPANAEDDGVWVEIVPEGGMGGVYVQPVGGYPNTIDRDSGQPIPGASPVFAGFSAAYRRAVFDLSAFAGTRVRARFHLWNDQAEGIFNRMTGTGWYLDDLEVSTPEFCQPPPALASAASGPLRQRAAGVALELGGSGFRAPIQIDAGEGITARSAQVVSSSRLTALLDVSASAAAGLRGVRVVNPDGQEAFLDAALSVAIDQDRADVDGSGGVDGLDLARLARAFGSFRGEPRYDVAADLDGDGLVDGADLAVLAANFGRTLAP